MDCAVRDLMLDFNAYWRAAEGQPLERRVALWRDLYEARHPDVFGHYFELWGDRGELLEPALGKLDAGKLPARGEQLMSVLRPAAARAGELLDAQSVPLHYVVMVGLFRADGWMADLEDTPTVFFCMEKLPDPGAYAAMVAHETTHLMHFAQKPDSWPDEAVGLNLLVEGLAVATARQVSPDLTPERLFIVDDFGAWLAACRVAWPRVTRSCSTAWRRTTAISTAGSSGPTGYAAKPTCPNGWATWSATAPLLPSPSATRWEKWRAGRPSGRLQSSARCSVPA